MEVTRKAVILKESRGQHPQTQNHSLKTMTTFNTDYNNNTELLDQELTIEQLNGVAGGMDRETTMQISKQELRKDYIKQERRAQKCMADGSSSPECKAINWRIFT